MASSSYSVVVSYSAAGGNYDDTNLPSSNYTYYYGETPYLNFVCGKDVYVFDATLYVYRNGSLYCQESWADVKAEMGWTGTYFRYWAMPVTFYDIGTYYCYFELTYNTNGPSSSTRASFTTGSTYFEVVDPEPVLRTDVSTINLNLATNPSITLYAWKNESVSYSYYFSYSKESSAFSCTWGDWEGHKAPLTVTAKNAVSNAQLTLSMHNSDDESVVSTKTITVNIVAPEYSITYNANGGTGAPSQQTKASGSSITLSKVIPKRPGYTFAGWGLSSSSTSVAYYPGDTFSLDKNTALYAVWTSAVSLSENSSFSSTISFGAQERFFKFTPSTTGNYVIYSTGSDDTYVYMYDSAGNQLSRNDDGGDNSNFKLSYNLEKGSTYYYGIRYFSATKTGTISSKFGRSYTIKYNGNGGSGVPNDQTKEYGSTLTLSSVSPSRTGYSFLGWSLSSTSSTAEYQSGDSYTRNGDTTLYAVWKDVNKPSATIDSTADTSNRQTATLTLTDNDGVVGYYWGTNSDYTKNTYTSVSKAKSVSVSKEVSSAGKYYLVVKDAAGNLSTAETIEYYTITYAVTSGVSVPTKQLKPEGKTVSLRSDVLSRFGYTFLGWSTSSSATSASYAPGATFSEDKNVTLYNVWKSARTLTSRISTSIEIDVANMIVYYMFVPQTSGSYVIYSTGSDDTRVYLYNSAGTQIASNDDGGAGTNFRLEYDFEAGSVYYFGVRYYKSSQTGTINFKFGPVFVVSYDTKGGGTGPLSQEKDYDMPLVLSSNIPEKSGYAFAGWDTSSSASRVVYEPGETYVANSDLKLYAVWVDNGLPAGSISSTKNIAPTQTVTLSLSDNNGVVGYYWGTYSSYSNNPYTSVSEQKNVTVTKEVSSDGTYYLTIKDSAENISNTKSVTFCTLSFDANSGTNAPATQLFMTSEGATIPSQVPKKTYKITYDFNCEGLGQTSKNAECSFLGWNKNASGSNEMYTAGNAFVADVNSTLYAAWGNAVFEEIEAPEREGYTFLGWYTSATGGTKLTQGSAISGNKTVYGRWEAEKYTVSFNVDGTVLSGESKEVSFGSALGALPEVEKEGYSFLGWYTDDSSKVTSDTVFTYANDITLYARWKAETYSVYFSPSGGSCSESVRKVTFDSVYGHLPVPEKEGYVFAGWFLSQTDNNEIKEDTIVSTASDHYLYARWRETLTVSFDANGGWDAPPAQTYTSGESIILTENIPKKSFTLSFDGNGGQVSVDETIEDCYFVEWKNNDGETFAPGDIYNALSSDVLYAVWNNPEIPALPVPVYRGYSFDGWYTEKTGGFRLYSNMGKMLSSGTVYAHWTPHKYDVTFDATGGELSSGTKEVEFAAEYGELPVPEREKYTFEGWYTAATGGNKVTSTTKVTAYEDHTLYARWKEVCTLSYAGEGITTDFDPQSFYSGDFVKVTERIPTLSYTVTFDSATGDDAVSEKTYKCTFLNWQDTAGKKYQSDTEYFFESDTVLYTQWLKPTLGQIVQPERKGYKFFGWYDEDGNIATAATVVSEDMSLEARWETAEYTVTFNAGGGYCEESAKTVAYGEAYGDLPAPVLQGHTFEGWYTDSEAGKRITSESVVSDNDSHTLYARWRANIYYISFDALGGSCATDSKEVTYGKAIGSLPFPEKEGMVFEGWFTEENGGEQLSVETLVSFTENITVYAKWTEPKVFYAVQYDPNGADEVFPTAIKEHDVDMKVIEDIPSYTIMLSFNAKGGSVQTPGTVMRVTGLLCWKAETPDGIKEYKPGDMYTYNYSTVMVAQWAEISYELETPVREGYIFRGWYTSDNPSVRYYDTVTVSNDTNFYAAWEADTVRVAFDPGEGSCEETEKTVVFGEAYGELPVCTNEGRAFVGWSVDGTQEGIITESTLVTDSDDHTLYAIWEDNILISFDATGGNNVPSNISIKQGEEVTISNLAPVKRIEILFDSNGGTASWASRVLYPTFDSWNTKPDGTGTRYVPGETYTFNGSVTLYAIWQPVTVGKLPDAEFEGNSLLGWFTEPVGGEAVTQITEISESMTIYAQWSNNAYMIYFDANGGTVDTESRSINFGAVCGTLPVPYRNGYEFDGWYTSNNVLMTESSRYYYTSNSVLYAKWTPVSVAVTFDPSGGELEYTEKTVMFDSYFGTLPIPVKENSVFAGWYTNDGTKVTEGTRVKEYEPITLVARWIDVVSVTYNATGGTGAPSEQRTNAGDSIYVSSVVPSKEVKVVFDTGFEDVVFENKALPLSFVNWNDKADGSGKSYKNGEIAVFNENTVLYACWSTASLGELPVPVKEGYVFDGWFSQKEGGEEITAETEVDAHITAYARYRTVRYTICFMDDDRVLGEKTVSYDEKVTLGLEEKPTKDDYAFRGWAIRPGGEKVYDYGYEASRLTSSDENEIFLYSVWKKNADVNSLSYSFENSRRGFGYDDKYFIPEASYQVIFGKNLYARAKYGENKKKKWNGNCFGMSSTSILMGNELSGVESFDFNETAFTVSELKVNDMSEEYKFDLKCFIEALQVSQFSPLIQEECNRNRNDYEGLFAEILEARQTDAFPVLCMISKNGAGHAIIGYDVRKISETETRIYVYDCNYPLEERYLTLTTSADGEVKSWSYNFTEYEDWGSKHDFRLTYVSYELIDFMWENRGDPATFGLDKSNSFHTNSMNFSIEDVDGNIVCKVDENGFTSYRDDVYDVFTLTSSDEERTGYDIVLPVDIYRINNYDDIEVFETNMLNVSNHASVVTEADCVTFIVADEINTNTAYVSGEEGLAYEISIESATGAKDNNITLSGSIDEEDIMISLVNNQLKFAVDDFMNSQLTINGKSIDLSEYENTSATGDVDNDGSVTAADARLALRCSVGLEDYAPGSAEFAACDVDKSETVTASDARLILRVSVGLDSFEE